MNAIIAWLWKHKMAVGFTIAVASAVGSYAAWLGAHDELVATRAVANERLTDYRQANENAETLHMAYRAVVTNTTLELARMDSLRAHADSISREAQAYAREASARLVKAGDSLATSMASIETLVIKAEAGETLIRPETLKPLITTARKQHREERRAQNDVTTALRKQLSATQNMLAAADSTNAIIRRSYQSLEDAYQARGVALQEARETVEAMAAGQDTGWSTFHKLTAGVALLAVGYLAGVGL